MKAERPQREKLPPISEQMKAWSAALATEFAGWPQVTQKSFFGFTALYRGKVMFGILPRTRSIFGGNSVAFRFDKISPTTRSFMEKDQRVAAFDKSNTRWFTFQVSSDADLHEALGYLGRAFDAARSQKKTR
ncbi:MAG: hypothetical protein WA477_04105 [Candidatus Sulfotelmatobacter sp.]